MVKEEEKVGNPGKKSIKLAGCCGASRVPPHHKESLSRAVCVSYCLFLLYQTNMTRPVPIFVLMGTAGCGKTSVAEELQKLLQCEYIEGDQLHPKENVDKMSRGLLLLFIWLIAPQCNQPTQVFFLKANR